jgi:hypothetical protein
MHGIEIKDIEIVTNTRDTQEVKDRFHCLQNELWLTTIHYLMIAIILIE